MSLTQSHFNFTIIISLGLRFGSCYRSNLHVEKQSAIASNYHQGKQIMVKSPGKYVHFRISN